MNEQNKNEETKVEETQEVPSSTDPNAAPKSAPTKNQTYKNVMNMTIFLTEVGRQLAPFGTITIPEERITGAVKHFIDSKMLVPVSVVETTDIRGRNDVVLPEGVKPSPEEFGTIISSGPKRLPGTAVAKSLEETLVTGQQKVQEGLDKIGEELKAADDQLKKN